MIDILFVFTCIFSLMYSAMLNKLINNPWTAKFFWEFTQRKKSAGSVLDIELTDILQHLC